MPISHSLLGASRHKSARRSWLSKTLSISVLLAILLGSPAEELGARAGGVLPAPEAAIYSFGLRVSVPENPLCVGKAYPATAKLLAHLQGDLNGRRIDLTDEGIDGLQLYAYSGDSGIVTVEPSYVITGPAGGDEPGGANFLITAKSAGTTNVLFQAAVPYLPGKGAPLGNLVEGDAQFRVVNCSYEISIKTTTFGQVPNVAETQLYSAVGEIDGEDTLTGTAAVKWKTKQVSSCFVTQQSVPGSTANFEGSFSRDGKKLTVRATFTPATLSNSVRFICGFGAAASTQVQLQPSPFSFSVSATGGTVSKTVSWTVGGTTVRGRATINVKPIEAK